MNSMFILFYIQTDNPEFSEILGVYSSKDKAVDQLLERANYRKNKEAVI